ncbi:GNAT family N-acetyltransferase [Pelagibius sp.]|uniref:GNAT family N-acetyltransferase n=1 Tax=Pelagibius sp. TaxID=1931238 RepID=UPI00262CB473|nr:GNAT family N-acetyltransferase [Pelagibius sp.]
MTTPPNRIPREPARLRVEAVTAATWPDMEALFEGRGGPHYCWCMVWRRMPSKHRRDKGCKKAALKQRVEDGTPVGLLGYLDERPVAWCSVGPRPSFRRLAEIEPDQLRKQPGNVWSIVCFYVQRAYRGQGLAAQLIEQAVAYAQAQGAEMVEAYPVEPEAPSYRFMGFIPQFARAGFTMAGKAGGRRHIMQRRLR